MIVNLVNNAVKYSPNADHIILSYKLVNNNVEICVRDYGIGIPADMHSKVFSQFFRAGGMHGNKFTGLGLGLYISSKIARQIDSRLWLQSSEEGKGSTFCFALPANNY